MVPSVSGCNSARAIPDGAGRVVWGRLYLASSYGQKGRGYALPAELPLSGVVGSLCCPSPAPHGPAGHEGTPHGSFLVLVPDGLRSPADVAGRIAAGVSTGF